MKALTEPLKEEPAYQKLIQTLEQPGGKALAEGCVASQKLHLANALSKESALFVHARCLLFLADTDKTAHSIWEEYRFYDRNVMLFPAKDLVFYQADLRSKQIEQERMRAFRRILEGRSVTVVTTFAALQTSQVPLHIIQEAILPLHKKQRMEEEFLKQRLLQLGYEKEAKAQSPGQFAVRGDLVDIYDLTQDNPIRIEFWDDEIESIRYYDPDSQRSIVALESVQIYPGWEMILSDEEIKQGLSHIRKEAKEETQELRNHGQNEAAKRLTDTIEGLCEEVTEYHTRDGMEGYIHYFYPETESFLDMFAPDETLIFLDEPQQIEEEAGAVEKEFLESAKNRQEKGYILAGQAQILYGREEIEQKLQRYRILGMTQMAQKEASFYPDCVVSMHARAVPSYRRDFGALTRDLKKYRKENYRVLLISSSRTRAKRLAEDLTQEGVSAFYSENPDRVLEPREVMTYYGGIAHGFEYPNLRFLVIAQTDIFGAEHKNKEKKPKGDKNKNAISDFAQLRPGDYVVHEEYGIGIYRGVEKLELDGASKDYLKIEYGAGGTLYVLPEELGALQKYASQNTAKPKLNKLGSQEWAGTKARVKRSVDEVAKDIVQLYAKRRTMKGHAFSKDTIWQKEFEESFPYEETQDQLAAIEDTKKDMESDRIMDRLICGDVGFGKTEIAIRAAFKAVQDGMQVAVLVPTTILAQQHFNTFTERMKEYPVCIEMLSRFQSSSEIKRTIEGLASGRVDIVIGTHRLLSKDVQFRNLGLLVVDEEQRFGVSHKEKIKKLKENVDVLTLSATPIPRTLQMSLMGIRDMSVLTEAPKDRMSVQTYVCEYDEEMVKEAILRELSRGGQVYYVYNRVNDIDEVTENLRQQIPDATIAYAHGQMKEAELEKIMYDFVAGDIDVLVSTTIIEAGMDIPNVNTMIICGAENMGLAQLYQLRGRVGRSNRTAYAFLMYRKDRMLKEEAQKRLSAIRDFTELGSGYRIALRDLEIRGAGNILGRAQHGQMAAVGYDLYVKMLDAAVKQAKGEPIEEEKNTEVTLAVDAYIPDSYIMNESQKLDMYKKISCIASVADCEDIKDELKDRYGEKIPSPAENLLRIALIRSTAAKLDIAAMTGRGGIARVFMHKDAQIQVENIPDLLSFYKGKLTFQAKGVTKGERKGQPYFELRYPVTGIASLDEDTLLTSVEELLARFSEYLRRGDIKRKIE